MAVFLTGSTGYLGAHVASNLLADTTEQLNLLVRAKTAREAEASALARVAVAHGLPALLLFSEIPRKHFRGDLTDSQFGLASDDYRRMVAGTDSVIHCAASLNRKSEKSCLNVNLRGTLEVIKFAAAARDAHGLRRFSHVSTVAVAGHRKDEVVLEDEAIDWEPIRLRPVRAHEEILRAHGRRAAARRAARGLPTQHYSRR